MRRICIAFLLMLITTPLLAHTLYMKDGRVLRGRIVAQTRTEIKIDVNGVVLTFPKTEVRQIEFDQVPPRPVQPVKRPEKSPEKKPEVIEHDAPSPLNRWNVAGRSAVLPGWGHWKAGEKWTGAGYFILSAGLAAHAIQSRSAALAAESNYESKTLTNFVVIGSSDPLGNSTSNLLFSALLGATNFNAFQTKVNAYNQSLQLFAVAYTGQIVHAWFTGRNLEQHQGAYFTPVADREGRPGLGFFYIATF